jgi:hypothetical protein
VPAAVFIATNREELEMGRVVVSEFVSLDGVMEAPGGEPGYAHSGWTFDFPDEGQYAFKLEETQAAEALLLGRVDTKRYGNVVVQVYEPAKTR